MFDLPLYKIVEPRVDPSEEECASSAVVPAVGDEGPQQVGMADDVLPTITDEFMCCVSMSAILLLLTTDGDEAFAVGESPTTSISSSSSITDVAAVSIFESVVVIETTVSVISDNC